MTRQLALRLERAADPDSALKRAWSHTRLRIPYEKAIRVPAIAICLRNLAAAETRRKIKARRAFKAASRQQPAAGFSDEAVMQ
jgi:hypothetical protein